MGKKVVKRVQKKAPEKRMPKKTKREFEILGFTGIAVSTALVISIFVASSLDSIFIRSQQYASVVAAVLVDLANKDRNENRLDGLKINPVLTKAAQLKADDMAAKSYFAHTSPTGIEPWHWFEEAGYKFSYAGENLAVDFSDSAAVNSAWMNSAAHRANILEQNYTEIGIATAQGFYQGRPTTFVVQEFGKPAAPTKKPASQVTKVPKNPTQPAVAQTVPARVLGESTVSDESSAESLNKDASQQIAGPSVEISYASPISHAVASPNKTLKYIYYGFSVLVLAMLIFATGFELHVRHIKKAFAAGGLVTLMIALFIVGDRFIFPAPIVPNDANMAAAATAL